MDGNSKKLGKCRLSQFEAMSKDFIYEVFSYKLGMVEKEQEKRIESVPLQDCWLDYRRNPFDYNSFYRTSATRNFSCSFLVFWRQNVSIYFRYETRTSQGKTSCGTIGEYQSYFFGHL